MTGRGRLTLTLVGLLGLLALGYPVAVMTLPEAASQRVTDLYPALFAPLLALTGFAAGAAMADPGRDRS